MFSRTALAVFATVVAEVVVARYAAQQIGAGTLVLVMVAAMVAGMVMLRRQLPALVSESTRHVAGAVGLDPLAGRASQTANGASSELSRRSMLTLAGILIAIPGLLTTAIGIVLTVPPIRVLAASRLRPLVVHSFPLRSAVPPSAKRRPPRRGDVVDVDVADVDVADVAADDIDVVDDEDIRKSARPELS